MPPLDDTTRDRILFRLKTRGPHTATELAERLERTPVAMRQQLARLERDGLVAAELLAGGPGRPARSWRLTPEGARRFPEGYADLALEILDGVRAAFGPEGLERLVAARTAHQIEGYRAHMPGAEAPLADRVAALAAIRSREGYMAEWHSTAEGDLLLAENHCPICDAARVCRGLCGAELELFEAVLDGARVERVEHVLEGGRRCAYRIRPGAAGAA